MLALNTHHFACVCLSTGHTHLCTCLCVHGVTACMHTGLHVSISPMPLHTCACSCVCACWISGVCQQEGLCVGTPVGLSMGALPAGLWSQPPAQPLHRDSATKVWGGWGEGPGWSRVGQALAEGWGNPLSSPSLCFCLTEGRGVSNSGPHHCPLFPRTQAVGAVEPGLSLGPGRVLAPCVEGSRPTLSGQDGVTGTPYTSRPSLPQQPAVCDTRSGRGGSALLPLAGRGCPVEVPSRAWGRG